MYHLQVLLLGSSVDTLILKFTAAIIKCYMYQVPIIFICAYVCICYVRQIFKYFTPKNRCTLYAYYTEGNKFIFANGYSKVLPTSVKPLSLFLLLNYNMQLFTYVPIYICNVV